MLLSATLKRSRRRSYAEFADRPRPDHQYLSLGSDDRHYFILAVVSLLEDHEDV
jgi:hypothetical protein